MDSPQQCEVHFPGNASRAANVSWSAFPAHQHSQSAHSSYRRTVSGQPHGYSGVMRDAAVSDSLRDVTFIHEDAYAYVILVSTGGW